MSVINLLFTTMGANDTSSYHDEEHASKDSENEVLVAKAVTMVVLCTVSTIMGIIPMFLAKWLKWDLSEQNPR